MILESGIINWFITNKFKWIWTGIVLLVVLFLMLMIGLFTSKIKKASSSRAKALTTLIQSALKILIIVIAIFVCLAVWGVNTVTGIIILCTVLFTIGLGAKDLIADVFAGMSNIFANTYEVGELVSIKNIKGHVVNITVTKTQIQTFNGELVTFNNTEITQVINYSRSFATAVVDIVISDYTNINYIQNLLEENLPSLREDYSQILEGPIVNGIEDISEGKVTLRITARTTSEMESIIQRAIRKKIIEIFNKNNIKLATEKIDVSVNKDE